jgi:hypothetical protein
LWNQFDEHGLASSLPRLKAESNSLYRHRIKDVFSHQANSSYHGLIHGITRELSLSLFDVINIGPRVAENGEFLAPDPLIQFDGIFLYLYSDYQNDLLDYQIDRFEPGGNYEYITSLVQLINSSTFFEASCIGDPYTRSMCIYNQSSRQYVDQEPIQASTSFKTQHPYLCKGTVFFEDTFTFLTEVAAPELVCGYGKYYIDYTSGIIKTFSVPSDTSSLRYWFTQYPFKAKGSPVILHDIGSENFKQKMFYQILKDNGEYTHGLPTKLGTDIINELLSVRGGSYFGD